jgi:hypothetical protein
VIAIAQLCEVIATGGKAKVDHPVMADLLQHGFLREAGVLDAVVCEECEAPHSAKVVSEGKTYGYYCSNLGFVMLERQRIRALAPDLPVLIDRLAAAFHCKRRKGSPVYGDTWRIGAAECEAGEVMLYFHPRLNTEPDLRACKDALSREVRSRWRLILTGEGGFPVLDAKAVALSEVVELDMATGAMHAVADLAELAGMPLQKKGGRPSVHGEAVERIITRRQRAGDSLEAVKAEARAVEREFMDQFPKIKPPSMSSFLRHVRKARGGS